MEEEKPPIASAAKWCLGVSCATVVFAAQTKPADAVNNISGWLRWLGIDRVPDALASTGADTWLTISGALGFMLTIWWMLRRSQRRQIIESLRKMFNKELHAETKAIASLEVKVDRASGAASTYPLTGEERIDRECRNPDGTRNHARYDAELERIRKEEWERLEAKESGWERTRNPRFLEGFSEGMTRTMREQDEEQEASRQGRLARLRRGEDEQG